jgi:tetraacyldisaccharide 4'-kinase
MLLWPLSQAVSAATARRVARPGWPAPIPVICCGNAGAGGAGKTTLLLDLAQRILQRDVAVHLLTRGHGGSAAGPLRVDPLLHTAREVGDEALLLAACAPTWMGGDRAATARVALQAGAQVLLLDDGLQNPTLQKTASLLVIDGGAGFGNGHVLPAGPLREPVHAAASRSLAAVLIGDDITGAGTQLPASLRVLHARLQPAPELAGLGGRCVVAFAGIGRPAKFFDMLEEAGVTIAHRVAFPDHHFFSAAERARILSLARAIGGPAVTTPKDFVRIPPNERSQFTPIGVSLAWSDEPALEALLDRMLGQ